MRLKYIIIFFILLPLFIKASHIEVSGPVSGIWNADTVFVLDEIEILSGQTLSVNPGVIVIFNDHFTFNVKGQILASGTENDSIFFTVADTTGFNNIQVNEGAWNGFLFDHLSPVNDSSIFEYCKFEYGKAVGEDSLFWYGGSLCIREASRIRISFCRFINNKAYKNGGAIYVKDANIKVNDCRFENNSCGLEDLYGYGGGICLEYSDAIISRNQFSQNQSTGVGGGLSFEYSDPVIESNILNNNYSAIGGGMVSLRSNGSHPVVNNLIIDNSALFFGGGVAFIESSTFFTNNTVVNNNTMSGGGLYINSNSFPIFNNCILWGNESGTGEGSQVYIWDTYSAPEFYYCDIEGGLEAFGGTGGVGIGFIGMYENNINMNPEFAGAYPFPFALSSISPCYNTGTPDTTGLFLPEKDLAGGSRIQENQIDMGAYEVQNLSGLGSNNSGGLEIRVFPNPARERIFISINSEFKTKADITIHDLHGIKIYSKKDLMLYAGLNQIEISNIMSKPGYYIMQVTIFGNKTNYHTHSIIIQ